MRKLSPKEIKQREERKAYMRSLYESGMTYEEIGETLGVSQQRVYQMIGGEYKNHFRRVSEKSCVFVGLRNWLNDNKVNVSDLVRRIYGEFYAESHKRLASKLRGRTEFKKAEIDKLLEITGLTYEEAFGGAEAKRDGE